MCTIYVLSGKVFGKDIYEIDCITNINDRLFSQITGFPEDNILHYSYTVQNADIKTCRNMILNSVYTYRMNNGNNFYKIKINQAIEQMEKIVLNINHSYTYKIEQKEKLKQIKKQSCF